MKAVVKILAVIFGILMIITGLYCIFNPDMATLSLGYAVGLSMVFDAIGNFAEWWQARKYNAADGWMLVGAILSAVFGFFVLNSAALQLSLDAFIVYYVAIWLVARGIISIVRAWKICRLHKNWNTKMLGTHWYLPLIIGILTAVFGILCLFKPLVMASVIGVFIGFGVLTAGANMITLAVTPENWT